MQTTTSDFKARGELAFAMILFGTIGLFVRNITWPSSMVALTRGLVGALFMAGLIRLNGRSPDWAGIRRSRGRLILSGICMGFNWILLFEAYHHTTVATATLSYYLAPVIVIIVSVITGGDPLTPRKAGSTAAALLGMVLVSGVLDGAPIGPGEFTGILFGLGAAVLYASVILLSKTLTGISSQDVTLVQLIVAGTVMIPYNLLSVSTLEPMTGPLPWISLAIVALVHTGFAYGLYFSSLSRLQPHTIALYSYLDPMVAVLASALILRETVGPLTWIGGCLILGSTLISEGLDRRRAQGKADPPAGAGVR